MAHRQMMMAYNSSSILLTAALLADKLALTVVDRVSRDDPLSAPGALSAVACFERWPLVAIVVVRFSHAPLDVFAHFSSVPSRKTLIFPPFGET